MTRLMMLVLIGTLIPLRVAGQSIETSRQQLEQTITKFYDAISRGDALSRVVLLDSNVILMPNGWTMIRGKQNVADVFTADTASTVFRLKDRAQVDMLWSDSLACTVNSYYYTSHKKGTPPNWRKTKNVHIWRRNERGEWKLRLDIWNSDAPIEFKER